MTSRRMKEAVCLADHKDKQDIPEIIKQFLPYLERMPDGPTKIYIQNRVIPQIDWYNGKSIVKQRRFKLLSVVTILLNALIPVATLLTEYEIAIRILIASISSAAVAINAILALCSYKELWVQYRSSCELLKSILYRFFNRSGEFHPIADQPDQCAQLLITLCEEHFTKEFQSWSSTAIQNSFRSTPPSSQGGGSEPLPQSPDSTDS